MAPHIMEAFQPDSNLHREAMGATAIGFAVLTVFAALRHRDSTRLVGTMSLFWLAISFVHLGDGHAEQIWSQELALHHLAIPLALLVLLQDYRFVLLDAFLRLLANVILAAVFVTASVLGWQLTGLPEPSTPFGLALSLAGACLVLVLFAVARTRVQQMLTRVLFRRPDESELLNALRIPIRDEEAYLEEAAAIVGDYASAPARITTEPDSDAQARVPIKTASGRTREIALGRRTGGRRYLSEDLATLSRAADAIAEQLELHHESEMRRLVSQAELRALQSQIHPHFLFNALNALYGVIPREAKGAHDTVLNLADIFRYFLDTRKTLVPLSEEMHIVTAYLDIERLRLGDKLHTEISIAPDAMDVPIPVLSIQPIVENAIKHGVAPLSTGGTVAIEIQREPRGGLHVTVSDTGRGFANQQQNGVGLENVRRRLELSYGGAAQLDIYSGQQGTTVTMVLPAHAMEATR
jgi:signal transduction histidine kinase